jgi:hypothetical protein
MTPTLVTLIPQFTINLIGPFVRNDNFPREISNTHKTEKYFCPKAKSKMEIKIGKVLEYPTTMIS